MNDFWSQSEHVRQYFCNQGHKGTFVETILSHVASLMDLFRLFRRHVITSNDIPRDIAHAEEAVNDPVQHHVLQVVGICLQKRDNYYNELDQHVTEESSDTSEEDIDPDLPDVAPSASHTENLNWKKFILVTGKPGTGKTHCLQRAIRDASDDQRKVLTATPTGFLATTYAEHFFDEIVADTVHSAFKYPVLPTESSEINWDLGVFDLVVIDEISLMPKKNS